MAIALGPGQEIALCCLQAWVQASETQRPEDGAATLDDIRGLARRAIHERTVALLVVHGLARRVQRYDRPAFLITDRGAALLRASGALERWRRRVAMDARLDAGGVNDEADAR